jgi:Ala-tRNA(Pro) deacylase
MAMSEAMGQPGWLNPTTQNGSKTNQMDATALFQYLDQLSIHYERHDHVAVYTSEQLRQVDSPLAGVSTKNLFLRDKKGTRHFLLVLDDSKSLDLKSMASRLGTTTLSLASAERLKARMGVEAGSVSLMCLVNDPEHQVEVLIDRAVWQAEALQCHPLINTATISLTLADTKKFLEATGHTARVIDL